MTLAKVKKQGLKKERNKMWTVLAKVTKQDGIMLTKVKVPSILTSAAAVMTWKKCRILFPYLLQPSITSSDCILQTLHNFQLLHPTVSSKHFTTVNYFIGLRPPNTLQLSITSSDCVLQTLYNCQLLHRTASSSLIQAPDVGILWTFTFASIIPSCLFTFASIIPSCSFPFSSLVPLLLQVSSLHFPVFH